MANFAVLGSPIAHSLSPKLHQAAFLARSLQHSYAAFETKDLAGWLHENQQFTGLSVTMPLKEQALALASEAADSARATSAANTLVLSETGWFAHNTDPEGVRYALRNAPKDLVVVIGSGATARSAIYALAGQAEVRVFARNQDRVAELTARFQVQPANAADLVDATVVSTLPSGALTSFLPQDLRPRGVLLDVAYHPWPSQAAQLWSVQGRVIHGHEMLVGQAIAQQKVFDSAPFDETAVLSSMRAALDMKE